MIKRKGVYKRPKSILVIPIQSHTIRDNQADTEPVMAKTINSSVSCRLPSIPQRSFNFLIFNCNEYKYNKFTALVRYPRIFVCKCFENKSYSYRLGN